MIVFGIDPGLTATGVGVLDVHGRNPSHLHHEVITTNTKSPLPERLGVIAQRIMELAEEYKPAAAAVEDIYTSKNMKSALLLGQTRGAIIAGLIMKGVPVHEFNAMQVKKAVVGHGRADKEQVRTLLEWQLKKSFKGTRLDATDALASALCLAFTLSGRTF